jgi:hypothetical protein
MALRNRAFHKILIFKLEFENDDHLAYGCHDPGLPASGHEVEVADDLGRTRETGEERLCVDVMGIVN